MRELSAGADAVLLEFDVDPAAQAHAAHVARALRAAVDSGALSPCDVVLTAHTILVEARPGAGLDELAVHRVARAAGAADVAATAAESVEVADVLLPVVYDGADLADAAATAGVSVETLVRTHSSTLWRVQFMGFAPGFGYLVPHPGTPVDDARLLAAVPRRDEARPAVPAGSVAVAAGYSAVYPRSSPGGWHLVGRTDAVMWDSAAQPPALLTAGLTVRFVDRGES
ncbi:5-oxoprolinase subunit B family protein [Gordonia shandongensis]|uniref:5-oxoprolinase subunit B family protein n=1 Tax=Gordonia shandongensis TaxID=376351 RepID=UPI00041378BB|nr:carboxyltransferase domain-containing protein [Gordonia shandongensis]